MVSIINIVNNVINNKVISALAARVHWRLMFIPCKYKLYR